MTDDAEMTRRAFTALAVGAASGVLAASPAAAAREGDRPRPAFDYDAVVVGGGPAGLSAALLLGRSCRRVLVCDAGKPRNTPSPAVHGFFSRDGVRPGDLLKIGRDQLKAYAVEWHDGLVTDAERLQSGFQVTVGKEKAVTTRTLVLATGVTDELPDIPGVKEWWGTGALHCPYCHGWEVRDKPWAFTGPPEAVVEKATLLRGWTKSLTYLSNGPVELTAGQTAWLTTQKVAVRSEAIVGMEGKDGKLTAVVFAGGRRLDVAAVFVHAKLVQRSDLPKRLGCKFVADGRLAGMVETDPAGATAVAGLYVVGDASAAGLMSVVGAVADGAAAASAANMVMLKDDVG